MLLYVQSSLHELPVDESAWLQFQRELYDIHLRPQSESRVFDLFLVDNALHNGDATWGPMIHMGGIHTARSARCRFGYQDGKLLGGILGGRDCRRLCETGKNDW